MKLSTCHCKVHGCGSTPGGTLCSPAIRKQHINEDRKRIVTAASASDIADVPPLSSHTNEVEQTIRELVREIFAPQERGGTAADILLSVNMQESRSESVLDNPTDLEAKLRHRMDEVYRRYTTIEEVNPINRHYEKRWYLSSKDMLDEELQGIAFDALPSSIRDTLEKIQAAIIYLSEDTHAHDTESVHPEHLVYDCSRHYYKSIQEMNPVILAAVFPPLILHLLGDVSREKANFLLATQSLIIEAVLEKYAGPDGSSRGVQEVSQALPSDIRTVRKMFDVEPATVTYATCPNCSCTYPPTIDISARVPTWPSRCTFSCFGGPPCNARLLLHRVNGSVSVKYPIRPFVYHSFHAFVGAMLSCPGIEREIEISWKSCRTQQEIRSALQSSFFDTFEGPDGRHFGDALGDELHLVWALSLDSFNPYANKISGKSVSAGSLAMVCLNLPLEKRYLPENMYLAGVVPGPREPSVEQNNHILRPLVDDLQSAWTPGIRYSRTHDKPRGRVAKSAMVVLVTDTISARKVAGHAAHGHTCFCSQCRLSKDQINNLDRSSWPRLNREEHLQHAKAWLDAKNARERRRLFKTAGIRWSELLLLPYWDPTRCVAVDGMHAIFLRAVSHHARKLLGLNVITLIRQKDAQADLTDNNQHKLDQKLLLKARSLLQCLETENVPLDNLPSISKMSRFPIPVLKQLCKEKNVPANIWSTCSRKKPLARALLGLDSGIASTGVDATLNCRKLSSVILQITRDVIANTRRPSWQHSLPTNFGQSQHGKLKADQLRTLMEFDLPVALVRWLSGLDPNDHQAYQTAKSIVDNTMDLAIAIFWGTSRRTSQHHADRYHEHMVSYLQGVQSLFPDINLIPSHHFALHIDEHLLRFGPMHSWWMFPFERLIGVLQKLKTNWKIGQLEETMAETYCARANLRRLMSNACPTVIQSMVLLVERHFPALPTSPSTLLVDAAPRNADAPARHMTRTRSPSAKTLEPDVYRALSVHLETQHGILFVENIADTGLKYREGGVCYVGYLQSSRASSRDDSLVYFETQGPSGMIVHPARIRDIFSHSRATEDGNMESEIFFALNRYASAQSRPGGDPFLPFPDFRAAVWSRKVEPGVEVVPWKRILCHAIQTAWDEETVVMRPLDRNY